MFYNCFGIIFLGLVGRYFNLLDDFNGIGGWIIRVGGVDIGVLLGHGLREFINHVLATCGCGVGY